MSSKTLTFSVPDKGINIQSTNWSKTNTILALGVLEN